MIIKAFWKASTPLFRFFLIATSFVVLTAPFSAIASRTTIVDGFDYPVGKPDAEGYYNAQGFFVWNNSFKGYHLGEDWNKKCARDCDLGDPVFSIATGEVIEVGFERTWGNVIRIRHTFINGKAVDSFYAHLNITKVKRGDIVSRGEEIGKIGKGDNNRFPAHLHFEIRSNLELRNGGGYGEYNQQGYLNPSEFIKANRPKQAPALTAAQGSKAVILNWNPSEDPDFDHYEIYKSEVAGGTGDQAKRTRIFSSADKEANTFTDPDVSLGQSYYYRISTYYKNGLVVDSEEAAVTIEIKPTKVTDNPYSQKRPTADGEVVMWEDYRIENGESPREIFYYNYVNKESGSLSLKYSSAGWPGEIDANGSRIVFTSANGSGGKNVYCYDPISIGVFPVAEGSKDQINPVVSEEGIVVWSDLKNGNDFDLYYLDLNRSNGPTPLVQKEGNQRYPRIWGNKVIWKDGRSGDRYDLYIKDINSSRETLLAENVGDGPPDIWGNWAAWNYKGKLHLLNIEAKEEKIISENVTSPAKVRDGRVAYVRTEGESGFIHVYEIETQKDTKINFGLNYATNLYLFKNILAFDHSEKQEVPDFDIYIINLQ